MSLIHLAAAGWAAYVLLGALVAAESTGVPLPGEAALIAAGWLAHRGRLDIAAVIAVAAGAAILGDNLGYVIGRQGGRRLLEAPGPFQRRRREVIAQGEPFFARHGAKAVFLGRWAAGLRIAAAWLAGISRMRWPVFLLWNALGGIAWATSIGLAAYLLGPAVERVVRTVGLAGVALVALAGLALFLVRRVRLRRASRPATLRDRCDASGARGTPPPAARGREHPAAAHGRRGLPRSRRP
jgi:undecaprenyl-diphosphatase